MSSLREECGVFGVFGAERQNVASTTYYGLFALQHRGQESCGIVVNDDGVFNYYKDSGLVNDVFTPEILENLGFGNMAVGHVRYGTTGASDRLNSQPVVINHHKGRMALAHNGNLVNSYELRQELELAGSIFHTTSDTEVISYIITKERIATDSIESAVNKTMDKIKGAYSLVIMSPAKLIAVRDPHGFRPLCYGVTSDGTYIIASETCALDSVSAKYVRDVEPGEILIFEKDGIRSIKDHCGKAPKKLCIFEHIYFARPDSVVDGVSVHEARMKAGACLAMEHPVQADVVIGVPDSGLSAAMGYAKQSGIPYGTGFIKNKYIGRTFIAPGQKTREDKVRIKLNVLAETVKGKRVVLVDDSIVRGTQLKDNVKVLYDYGAKEVHMRIGCPPLVYGCPFIGFSASKTDMELITRRIIKEFEGDADRNLDKYSDPSTPEYKRMVDRIAEMFGMTSLKFNTIETLVEAIGLPRCQLCTHCFDGSSRF